MAEKKPRERQPSDEAWNDKRRKTKPHVRIHHSVTNHRKTARIWQDDHLLARFVRILMAASDKGAAHTFDTLTLRYNELPACAGIARIVQARDAVVTLARLLEWPTRDNPDARTLQITIRNFARKQGITPRRARKHARTPRPSPLPSPLFPPLGPQTGADEPEYPPEFERVWRLFPKRSGANPKRLAFEAWRARRNDGVSAETLESATIRYAEYCSATGKVGTDVVQQGATFFGPKKAGWKETWELPRGGGRYIPNHPVHRAPGEFVG